MKRSSSFILVIFFASTFIFGSVSPAEPRIQNIQTVESSHLCNDYSGVKGYHQGYSSKNTESGFCPEAGVMFYFETMDARLPYQFGVKDKSGNLMVAAFANSDDQQAKQLYNLSQDAHRMNMHGMKKAIQIRYDASSGAFVSIQMK